MSSKKVLKSNFQSNIKRINTDNYSTENSRSIWLFDMLDKNGSFAFDLHSNNFNHRDFLDKMISYSNMTWAEIKRQTHDNSRSKHHFLKLDSLSKSALERVKFMKYDQLYPDQIFSFAFTNTLRIIGIRIDEYFHVVWYDSNHQFCPSHLKHT